MRGLTGRVATNVVWVAVFSVLVVGGALVSFASGFLFQNTYTVRVPMPEGGGVLPGQEVTVLGRAVGTVEDVQLSETGVMITLAIDERFPVPAEANVRVLRRSPIGEQAVNFEPIDETWEPADKGATIEPVEARVPAEVPFLLEETVELFEAIDLEDVTVLIRELGTALRGRGELLRELNRDSLDLNATLVEGIPDFERLIDSSQVVLAELSEHREALAASFTNAADLTEVLAEQRPTLETLLDTGTTFLEQTDALIRNERANFHCLMADFTDVNEMLLGPTTATGAPARFYETKLDELEMALEKHRFFFQDGYNIISQPDPLTGADWIRVLMLPPQDRHGEAYPERVPTPATLPGAACRTDAWGLGVNAVRQADHQPPAATSPGIDFAPLASGETDRTDPGPAPGTGAGSDEPLPATGGGLFALAPLLVALAVWVRRLSS